jgi:hypothetical protein
VTLGRQLRRPELVRGSFARGELYERYWIGDQLQQSGTYLLIIGRRQ